MREYIAVSFGTGVRPQMPGDCLGDGKLVDLPGPDPRRVLLPPVAVPARPVQQLPQVGGRRQTAYRGRGLGHGSASRSLRTYCDMYGLLYVGGPRMRSRRPANGVQPGAAGVLLRCRSPWPLARDGRVRPAAGEQAGPGRTAPGGWPGPAGRGKSTGGDGRRGDRPRGRREGWLAAAGKRAGPP